MNLGEREDLQNIFSQQIFLFFIFKKSNYSANALKFHLVALPIELLRAFFVILVLYFG